MLSYSQVILYILLFKHSLSFPWSYHQPADADLLVDTKFGPVQGIHYPSNYSLRSTNPKDPIIKSWPAAYLGIPFALPPVKTLRFRDPVAWNKTWKDAFGEDTFLADRHGKQCLQVLTIPNFPMAEDCLYLNVYTPTAERMKRLKSRKLPVMFWVYGGAFSFGAGGMGSVKDQNVYSGSFITSMKDVLVVTFNHRLGANGFLTTKDSVDGNMGVMDVKMAYRWTVENIESFGGDPNEITIFGMSSGGYMSLLVALDPSLPPVKRVIAMSPPTGLKSKTKEFAANGGRSYLKKVGCKDGEDELECLQKLRYLRLMYGTIASEQGWLTNMIRNPLKWLPVSDHRKYIDRPLELLEVTKTKIENRLKQTEFMFGVAQHEAALFVAIAEGFGYVPGGSFIVFKGTQSWRHLFLDWLRGSDGIRISEMIMSINLFSGRTFQERQYISIVYHMFNEDDNITMDILSQYPPKNNLNDNIDQIVEIVTDYMFICPTQYLARKLKPLSKSVYLYEFAHEPKYAAPLIGEGGRFNRTPVAHALDVPFFWNYFPQLPKEDKVIADMYSDYFSGFAAGDIQNHCIPQSISSYDLQISTFDGNQQQKVFSASCQSKLPVWQQFDGDFGPYLAFEATGAQMKQELKRERCQFWDSLKNPMSGNDKPYQF